MQSTWTKSGWNFLDRTAQLLGRGAIDRQHNGEMACDLCPRSGTSQARAT
jgi:hypothetical protein